MGGGTALSSGALSPGAGDDGGGEAFATPLAIPPLAEAKVAGGVRSYTLEARSGLTELLPGVDFRTMGYNGTFLGPTLRAARGETVRVDVTNALTTSTTVHWHGMHLPAAMDGGPHQSIARGQTWSPNWTIDQPAATLWYHPHPHGADRGAGVPRPGRHVHRRRRRVRAAAAARVRRRRHPADRAGRGRSPATGSSPQTPAASVGPIGDQLLVNGTRRPPSWT